MNTKSILIYGIFYLFCYNQTIDSIGVDSLKTSSIDSIASFNPKTHQYKTKLYPFNLFSTNRQRYLVANGFYPNSSRLSLDGYEQRDLFSGGYDLRGLSDERISSYQLIGNKLTAKRHQVDFLIPFTKLDIIDGDFGFTEVDILYMQRYSGNLAVTLNINNTTSDGGFGNALYESPAIDGHLYYDFTKQSHLTVSYGFKRTRFVDFGYATSSEILLQQEYKHVDIAKMLLADYRYYDWTLDYQYQQQKRNGYFDDDQFYFQQSSELHQLSVLNEILEGLKLGVSYSTQFAKGTILSQSANANKLILESKWAINDSNQIELTYSLMQGQYANLNNLTSPVQLDVNLEYKSLSFETIIARRTPTVNELFYQKPVDQISDASFINQLSEINANPDLKNEIHYFGKLSSEILPDTKLSISALYYVDKIAYSALNKRYENVFDSYHSSISLESGNEIVGGVRLHSQIDFNYQRNNSYLPNLYAWVSLQKKFMIFRNLKVHIDLYGRYFGERFALDYNRYTELFSLNRSVIFDPVFVPAFKMRFTIKTVDIIFEMENPFNRSYPVVYGYGTLSSRVLFGIKWGFIN